MPVPATGASRRSRRIGAFACILAVFALLAGVPAAFAAMLTVTITGVHSDKGNVYVALFDTPNHFPNGDYSIRHLKVKASTAPIVVAFNNLPPGTYAVGCYHDEDMLGHFKTNFFGYPLDGYALSNGIRAVVSRPTFAEAAFPVAAPDTDVTLHVKY
ncbi:MAG: DUF2141 domain-containing protein [Acetobacteraceae bacterium]